MILWLVEWLLPHASWVNAFTYITTRAIFAAITAFALGNFLMPHFIRAMKRRGQAQPIRADGPQTHLQSKQYTPTMGGLVMLTGMLLSALLWADWQTPYLWLMLFVTIVFGLIGGVDDYLKIIRASSRGISARVKLGLQSAAAVVILIVLWRWNLTNGNEALIIPYLKDTALVLGIAGFFVIGFLAIVGASNAVNLTDGLDGLAILMVVLVAGGLGIYAYISGSSQLAAYFYLPSIPAASELTIFCAALAGAGLSFLWFNAHPAEVFMGDVGSLAIGAVLATVAVVVRQEIVFVIMSLVFVAEAASVILQVGWFKMSGGKRVFRMAPIHHHFELQGWKENQVVVRFWILTLICVLVGLAAIKIR